MREEELALRCFDGDPEKAEALLELLHLSEIPCATADLDMLLPDECRWEKDGKCWRDIPDSCITCRKPCNFFELRIL